MCETMTIHMRSGKSYDIKLDPNDLTPVEQSETVYQSLDFANTTVLKLNDTIIMFREIEAITFK